MDRWSAPNIVAHARIVKCADGWLPTVLNVDDALPLSRSHLPAPPEKRSKVQE